METTSKPGMLKPAMTHGLMIGAALIIFTLILYISGQLQNQALSWVGVIISFAGILYALFNYRNQTLGGFIDYGKAIVYSILVGLFMGIVSGLFAFLLYGVISPDLVEESRQMVEREMWRANPDLTDEMVDMAMKFQRIIISPLGMLISSIFSGVIQGVIFGLIGGLFVKKANPNPFG